MDKKNLTLYILAWIVVTGFFALVGIQMFVTIPQQNLGPVNQLFGALAAGFGMVLSYFFGSSKGSADKTEIISKLPPLPPSGQGGFADISFLGLITGAMLVAFLSIGCSIAPINVPKPEPALTVGDELHPVETMTNTGEGVQEVAPPKTMDRKDVPAGVDPDKVIAHIEDKSTKEEVWVVDQGVFKKPKIYQKRSDPAPTTTASLKKNEARKTDGLTVNTAKPSNFWIWAGILFFILIVAFFLARRFIPFFGVAVNTAETVAQPVLQEVAKEAGEASAHALKDARTWRERLCEQGRALLGRIAGKKPGGK